MVAVGFGRIYIGIHLYVPRKAHQAFAPFIIPPAVKSFDKPAHFHPGIIFDLYV